MAPIKNLIISKFKSAARFLIFGKISINVSIFYFPSQQTSDFIITRPFQETTFKLTNTIIF